MSPAAEAAVDLEAIEARLKSWSPKARAEVMRSLEKVDTSKVQRWFCDRIRKCDGMPHGEYDYPHARADQWPPPGANWLTWLIMSGRGSGKTRSGSGWVRNITRYTGRIAGIGRRGPDVRQVMVEGPSGLIRSCELAGETYDWQPSKKEFTFQNGAKFFGYSAEEPDTLRGPEHGATWLDEPAHMPLIEDVWSNMLFGLRIPGMPGGAKILCTTTPLPTKWVKKTMALPKTKLVRVSTSVNIANLDAAYLENVIEPLKGTRIGRQELDGEVLEDVEGALWHGHMIVRSEVDFHEMHRIVVAIDPAGTANRKSDETGIVAVGIMDYRITEDGRRIDEETGYVLADESGRYSPEGWAKIAIRLYETFQADAIVVETNFGGDMVRQNLKTSGFDGKVIESRAMRGKQLRAEPVVNRYEQKKVRHNGSFAELEDEMTTWIPGKGASPNRIDALVWGFTELFKITAEVRTASPLSLPSSTPYGGFPGGVPSLSPLEAAQRSGPW